MLLREIVLTEEQKLINEGLASFQELNLLCEGFGDGFMDLVNTMKSVSASNGKKNELNDRVIGDAYSKSRMEFKQIYDNTSSAVVRGMYDKTMLKLGVKISGVDISRSDNIKKLCSFKFLIAMSKSFRFVMKNVFGDQAVEQIVTSLVSLFLPALTTIAAAIFAAKSAFEMLKAIIPAGRAMKEFYAKANQARKNQAQRASNNTVV